MIADQAMMLSFARERAHYSDYDYQQGISIKGDKSSDMDNDRTQHNYADLIQQDINAITISAPK